MRPSSSPRSRGFWLALPNSETVWQSTCYGKESWGWRDGTITWRVTGLSQPKVRVAQMNYTDARWVLFMGRIPGADKTRAEYAIIPRLDDNKIGLEASGGAFGALPKPPQSENHCKSSDVELYVLFVSSSAPNVIAGRPSTNDSDCSPSGRATRPTCSSR